MERLGVSMGLFGVLLVAAAIGSFFVPGAYRSVALVRIDAPSELSVEPLRFARRIADGALEPAFLEELTRALDPDGRSEPAALLALRRALGIATADGRTFRISFTDSRATRAQLLATRVADQIVARAPVFLRSAGNEVVTARLVAGGTSPSWPSSHQSFFLAFGALAALVVAGAGVDWQRRFGRESWQRRAGGGPFRTRSESVGMPTTTTPLPGAANAKSDKSDRPPPPALGTMQPTTTATPVPSADVSPPPRTEPMLPPPTPREPLAAANRSLRTLTLAGLSGPVPVSLRRSTLIFGSPIAPPPPAPLHPDRPTPTSIFRPSPPPPPVAPVDSTAASGSSRPPPTDTSSPALGTAHPEHGAAPGPPRPASSRPPAARRFQATIGPSSRPPEAASRPASVSSAQLRQDASSRSPNAPSSAPPPSSMASSRRIENLGARYSYVSTPVPARPSSPVEHRDASYRPSVTLDVDAHKPWRRQLFSLGVAQCCVVAVTSVGEGRRDKARFAAELALCLAQTGHSRVLLVEADFGEPILHRLLDVTLTAEEAIARQLLAHGTRQGPWSLLRLKPSLSALLQDKTEPPELILGEIFRDGLIALSDVHDFVVIHGPPDESGLAARAFSAWVDGVVIVAHDQAAPDVVRAMANFGPRKFQQVFVPKPPGR